MSRPKTYLLARHQAVVGSDEHVLRTAHVHAAGLEAGWIVHARYDLSHLLGGHLRDEEEEERARDVISERGRGINSQAWVTAF